LTHADDDAWDGQSEGEYWNHGHFVRWRELTVVPHVEEWMEDASEGFCFGNDDHARVPEPPNKDPEELEWVRGAWRAEAQRPLEPWECEDRNFDRVKREGLGLRRRGAGG
jgi:hypothetical protein